MSHRSERFFLWVWRLNGLLLLCIGLVSLAGAFVLAFNISRFASRDQPEQQLTQVAGADLRSQDLRLGDFREISGTTFLYAQLAAPSEYIGSGSSGGRGDAHNLLFFDTVSKKAHWLLPSNDQIISSVSFLMDPPRPRYDYEDGNARERNQVAVALLVELDQPHGNTSANGGTRSLAIASPEGRGLSKVADSIDGLLGYHLAAKDSVLVFYVSGGAARVLELDPVKRTVASDQLLSAQE